MQGIERSQVDRPWLQSPPRAIGVISTIDTTRWILDSIVRLRREMGHQDIGIPRWPSSASNAPCAITPKL
jgi:hypothetical protein